MSNSRDRYFDIVSAWSCAGVGTCLIIQHAHDIKTRLAFDLGCTPNFADAIPASHVIISHSHLDHIGAVFNHARAHRLACGGSVPTYYVPSASVPKLKRAQLAMSCLDNHHRDEEIEGELSLEGGSRSESSLIQMNVVGMGPGDEVELRFGRKKGGCRDRLFLRAFAVDHRDHPALGYVISRTTTTCSGRSQLKEEYRGLSGREIGELIRIGTEVKMPVEETTSSHVEIAYTGDTCAAGLLLTEDIPPREGDNTVNDDNFEKSALYLQQAFNEAQILFMEVTFLDYACEKQMELAASRGHVHISEVIPVLLSRGWFKKSDDERLVVLIHISLRHRPAAKALDLIVDGLRKSFEQSPLIENKCDDEQEQPKPTFGKMLSHFAVAIQALLPLGTIDEKNARIRNMLTSNGCVSLKTYEEQKALSPDLVY